MTRLSVFLRDLALMMDNAKSGTVNASDVVVFYRRHVDWALNTAIALEAHSQELADLNAMAEDVTRLAKDDLIAFAKSGGPPPLPAEVVDLSGLFEREQKQNRIVWLKPDQEPGAVVTFPVIPRRNFTSQTGNGETA